MKKRSILLGDIYMYSWNKGDSLVPKWWDSTIPDKDEVILDPDKTYVLTIDYPLSTPAIIDVVTDIKGMTRENFVDLVTRCYREIYEAEANTSSVEPTNIPGMLNRVSTNGDYGIWGHDLSDLALHTLYVKDEKYLTLGVDS